MNFIRRRSYVIINNWAKSQYWRENKSNLNTKVYIFFSKSQIYHTFLTHIKSDGVFTIKVLVRTRMDIMCSTRDWRRVLTDKTSCQSGVDLWGATLAIVPSWTKN